MSYSDTTLDRRLQLMSPRQDLSSTKEFRPGSSRFRLSRNILSLSDIGGPTRRSLLPASRPINPQRLSKRFSSASSPLSASSSSQPNSLPSAMGGVMAATSSSEPPIIFWTPDVHWQKSKARLFGLDVQQSHWFSTASRRHSFPSDTPPKTCEAVAGDGNCLFRAFSFWITGSEDFHIEVRPASVIISLDVDA